jgi:DNA-binding response OmpR family regulator
MKVLIVDDEFEFVEVLECWLAAHGYEVLTCDRALEAAGIAGREMCDVVLLDVMLPDANGLTVLSDIIRTAPNTRIIVMSALHKDFWMSQARDGGAWQCISKPIDLHVLLNILNQIPAHGQTA